MLIQTLRLRHGWSQQQLAELAGLSTRTIQRIERGSPASTETLKSLASVFEIDFTDLNQEHAMPDDKQAENQERLALAHVRRVKGFYFHCIQYVIVIAVLFIINAITLPQYWWAAWPALGWGVGLMTHAACLFNWFPFFGAEWERRQVERRLGRPL
jgi:transcriptional regulator with XRE-family HTH domain